MRSRDRGAGDLLALLSASRLRRAAQCPDSVLKLIPKNGGVVMVTFVPGFLSNDVAHDRLERAERDKLTAAYPNDPAAVNARSTSGGRRIRLRARRSRKSPSTSITSEKVAGINSTESAATSMASTARPSGSRTSRLTRR